MTERERIEDLHQKYLSLRENTPMMKRDGEECKAYHKWYDSAYVYFKSYSQLQSDSDFQIFVNADKEGNCFVLEHIYDTISPSYKVLMIKTDNMPKMNNDYSLEKTPMAFISHSSKDKQFAEALVEMLEDIGFDSSNLFCSSVDGYGVGLSEDIFETLRGLFQKHNLYVIFIHSPRYYTSPVSLNEMGAAWVLRTDFCSFLTTDMDFSKMKGVVNGSAISIKVDAEDTPARLTQLKDKLTQLFHLPKIDSIKWERKRSAFIKAVNAINYVSDDTAISPSPIDDEYKRLQVEKLKREEMERKQAKVRGNIIEGRSKGSRILKIFNSGQSKARNVSVEWLNPDDSVIVQQKFGLLGEISPQSSRSYNMVLSEGHIPTMRLRYTWSDDNDENNTYEEDVQI